MLDRAFAHHGHALAQRHGLDLIVRDVEGGDREPFAHPGQFGAHGRAQLRVQIGERFVHQERLRPPRDGAAHGDALQLPTGQFCRAARQQRSESEQPGDIGNALAPLALAHAA